MRSWQFPLIICVALSFPLLANTPAQAQATRTWVSGVGDDANPCSRTAPCKTFAGAISKTATGGEINVLDPGGFGAVTITKSITISDEGVGEAGVLVSGTNGIIVAAPVGAIVNLRGLVIDGIEAGLSGIRYIGGSELTVENCVIMNFLNWGIDAEPNNSNGRSRLFVKNTLITNNGSGALSGGIFLSPAANTGIDASIDGVQVEDNVIGLRADGTNAGNGVHVSLNNSVFFANAGNGIWAIRPGGGGQATVLDINNVMSTSNTNAGVLADGGANVLLSSSKMVSNGTGASVANGGHLFTYQNNVIDNNVGEDLSAAAVARGLK